MTAHDARPVVRYSVEIDGYRYPTLNVLEDSDGEWVRATDYDALRARAEAAEAVNSRCHGVLAELTKGIDMAIRAGLDVEGSYVVKATGLCAELLRAALNYQGQGNG